MSSAFVRFFTLLSFFCATMVVAEEFPLQEVLDSWHEIKNHDVSFHCELIQNATLSTVSLPTRPVRIQFDVKGQQFACDSFVRGEKQISHIVEGSNRHYNFAISTDKEEPDWSIDQIVKSVADEHTTDIKSPLNVLWDFFLVSALDVFQDPSFKIIRTEYNAPFWIVEFEIHSQSSVRYLASIRSGRAVLDSSANYCIKEFQLNLEFPNNYKVHTESQTEYTIRKDFPFPIPIKSFDKSKSLSGDEETNSYEYKEFRLQEFDDQYFMLSRYGLPEPDPIVYDLDSELQKKKNKRLFFLGIGFGFIILGLGMLLYLRWSKKS
jgi:hypothetical protein